MKFSRLIFGFVVMAAMTVAGVVRADTADQAYAKGKTLLAQGSFEQALQAFAVAVRAAPTNQQYGQQFLLVRRVIALRQNLKQEKDPERWMSVAQSLRSFYVSEKIYSEALPIDEKIHAKLNSASSAGNLAETQLALGKEAEALQMLSALPPAKTTPVTEALRAIALARNGDVNEARKISENTVIADSDAGTFYVCARMHAVVGNHDESLDLLARCFEAVPPSRLEDLKVHAKQNPDFGGLASTSRFSSVLRTKSKVAESTCSSGSSCAGCPMRASCAKSQGNK
jgi:tetratricopeptide (TPR) repeat protein